MYVYFLEVFDVKHGLFQSVALQTTALTVTQLKLEEPWSICIAIKWPFIKTIDIMAFMWY